MVRKRNTYRLLVGKPEGKSSLGRPRIRLVVNIMINIGKIRWGVVDLPASG
jgi:hypothetical protein